MSRAYKVTALVHHNVTLTVIAEDEDAASTAAYDWLRGESVAAPANQVSEIVDTVADDEVIDVEEAVCPRCGQPEHAYGKCGGGGWVDFTAEQHSS